MYSNSYLGAPVSGLQKLQCINEDLSAKVLEQINSNQEILTLNDFEHQSNIESWRWVLQDLSNRLEELIQSLKYEHKALRVVVERVKEEINRHSEEGSKPGALSPQSDPVEDAINMEYKFLQEQKRKFEQIIRELDEQIPQIQKVKKRIEVSALNKEEAIHVEEKLPDLDVSSRRPSKLIKKKSLSPLDKWERQCFALKKKGLCALSHAMSIRQQVRGCRRLLSVTAQSYATRVDSLLKRRLYLNKRKIEDLQWQKGEAQKDLESLSNELTATEQNVLETMEKVRLMEARLADRKLRPHKELTKDPVDRKLKDELQRLKKYLKYLRNNIDRITSLQGDLTASIVQMNCVEEELSKVIDLDENRIRLRTYDDEISTSSLNGTGSSSVVPASSRSNDTRNDGFREHVPLSVIKEEDEVSSDDDYPLDY
ncbi:structural maintenance of chromosomes protein 1A-like [Leguminivora glycinivorella]|uniref:structural maintenance of chromosomes protein 1A-like n=1 Tax=Leguminivora glycinivorella TaxID=1035111 RepID=UPI00200E3286|nr:structural maintenance of chromosomes protein 1A-like [Leguminivora glycinivorella]